MRPKPSVMTWKYAAVGLAGPVEQRGRQAQRHVARHQALAVAQVARGRRRSGCRSGLRPRATRAGVDRERDARQHLAVRAAAGGHLGRAHVLPRGTVPGGGARIADAVGPELALAVGLAPSAATTWGRTPRSRSSASRPAAASSERPGRLMSGPPGCARPPGPRRARRARVSSAVTLPASSSGTSADRKRASTEAARKRSTSKTGWWRRGNPASAKRPKKMASAARSTPSSKVTGMYGGRAVGGPAAHVDGPVHGVHPVLHEVAGAPPR